jgi:hypothetical protein
MNPTIVELCAAVLIGLLAAAPWCRYGRRVGQETAHAIDSLSRWIGDLPPVRSEDGTEAPAKHRREVSA